VVRELYSRLRFKALSVLPFYFLRHGSYISQCFTRSIINGQYPTLMSSTLLLMKS